MKPTLTIIIIMSLLLVGIASAGNVSIIAYTPSSFWCYQEFANESTTCGGLNTGRYNATNTVTEWNYYERTIDGDFGTGGSSNDAAGVSYSSSWVNYTKPTHSVGAIWRVSGAWYSDLNLTVSPACFSTHPTKLILRVNSSDISHEANVVWACLESSWTVLNSSAPSGAYAVSEEAIWWNMSSNLTLKLSTSYNDLVIENSNNVIILLVNKSLLAGSYANLSYNGTYYQTSTTFYPTYTIFQATVTNNTVGATNPTNVSQIFFNFTLYDDNEIIYNGSTKDSNISQLVYQYTITNCSTVSPNATITTRYFLENSNATNQSTLNADFMLFQNSVQTLNYSFVLASNYSHAFCLSPFLNTTLTWNAIFRYPTASTRTRNYYVFDQPLSNSSVIWDLYITNESSSLVYVYVKDLNDQPLIGARISALHKIVGTGHYITVESGITDINGQTAMYLYPNSEIYQFLITFGNRTFNVPDQYILASVLTLNLDLEGDYTQSYTVTQAMSKSLTFDQTTKTFTYTFADTSGGVTQGCLQVSQAGSGSLTSISHQCSAGSSGTMSYSLTGTPSGTYVAQAFATVAGIQVLVDDDTQMYQTSAATWGSNGPFWSAIIIGTSFFLGIWSPFVAILLSIMAIIGLTIAGILAAPYSIVVTLVVILLFVGMRSKT